MKAEATIGPHRVVLDAPAERAAAMKAITGGDAARAIGA
jgi:hypothetical protein